MAEPLEETFYRAKIITPGGFIIPVEYENFPKTIRNAIKEHDPVLAAQSFSLLTGCRVTIEEKRVITANEGTSK